MVFFANCAYDFFQNVLLHLSVVCLQNGNQQISHYMPLREMFKPFLLPHLLPGQLLREVGMMWVGPLN